MLDQACGMDRHIAEEFANTLLDACQECDTETISPQFLIEPKFLADLSAFFGNILGSRTSLPHQLQDILQNALHTSGFDQFDDVFGEDVTRWMKFEIDTPLGPEEDTATRLYDNLSKLPKPRTVLQKAMRQVYTVELYHLRKMFNESFTSPNREPLITYISVRRGIEVDTVRTLLKEPAYAGERLDAIAKELDGFGALLLPHNVARTTLEKRISIKGPELNDFNGAVQSLREQGVLRNESTQIHYDLAARFFTRRNDDGIRLVESLRQSARSHKWTRKRFPIDQLIISQNPTTSVENHLLKGQLLPKRPLRPQDGPPLQNVTDSSKASDVRPRTSTRIPLKSEQLPFKQPRIR